MNPYPDPNPKPMDRNRKGTEAAKSLALWIMDGSDLNANGLLSFTELTQNLKNSKFQGFTDWIMAQKQAGFRALDVDQQGTLDLTEITIATQAYLNTDQGRAFAEAHPESLVLSEAPDEAKYLPKGKLYS